ncbi:MAG TPA: tRNA pseudouridine(38-40) synthase TruA, partial [Rhodocyclaceae bacterium]|nr:tRNA pseudouridine(38-40) synthase TruA [Rhodocyclaceae bacterium]
MPRVAIGLEYDGRDFEGWQAQTHRRTVQDAVEQALSNVAAAPIAVVCAGRTDSGVHAAVQVVHFDTNVIRPLGAWVRGANANLPNSIAVRWAIEVDDQFHARFSAKARRYRYILLNRSVRSALHHGKVGWFHTLLDVEAMQKATSLLTGEHDFSAFRAAECQAASPIRNLAQACVERYDEWIIFEFEANAFLHHMVRNMVG